MLFYTLFRDDPRMLTVGAGSVLFREGDEPDVMYVLIEGDARVMVGNLEVERLEPGAIVGEMALIAHEPRSASVEAVSPCRFACIDEPRFRFLVSETPGFALAVMRTLAVRLRGADHLLRGSGDK